MVTNENFHNNVLFFVVFLCISNTYIYITCILHKLSKIIQCILFPMSTHFIYYYFKDTSLTIWSGFLCSSAYYLLCLYLGQRLWRTANFRRKVRGTPPVFGRRGARSHEKASNKSSAFARQSISYWIKTLCAGHTAASKTFGYGGQYHRRFAPESPTTSKTFGIRPN